MPHSGGGMEDVLDRSAERARKGLGLIALAALLTALILGLLSALSDSTFKQIASDLSGHHQAKRVTDAFLAELKLGLRISSLALAGLAAGLLLLRRRLGYIVCEVGIAFAHECKHAWQELHKIITMATANTRQAILVALVVVTASSASGRLPRPADALRRVLHISQLRTQRFIENTLSGLRPQ